MNKTKTTLAAVGGVTLVAMAAAGYFVWSAHSARTVAREGDDEGQTVGLDPLRDRAAQLVGKPVYPGAASVKALDEMRDKLVAWKEDALLYASRGDRGYQRTDEAELKEFIVSESRRLATLPAGKDQKTLDAAFDFGPFKPYISGGMMPAKESLNELERKWYDVTTIIETLSENGIDSITSIALKTDGLEQPKEEDTKQKKGKKKGATKKKSVQLSEASQPVAFTYVVACKSRPSALVKTLNALAKSDRFMSVVDMSFTREKDLIAEGLSANTEKKEETETRSRRRPRRSSAAVTEEKTEEQSAEAQLYTVVTDPAEEPPFTVSLTVTVYDFRTSEKNKEGEVEK